MTHNIKGGEPFVDWGAQQPQTQQPGPTEQAPEIGPVNAVELGRVIHSQIYEGGAQQFTTHEGAQPVMVPLKEPIETLTDRGVRSIVYQELMALIRTPGNELFGAVRLSLKHDNAQHSAVVLTKVPSISEQPSVQGNILTPKAETTLPFNESGSSTYVMQDPSVDAYQQPCPYWQVGVTYDPWEQSLHVQQYGAGSHMNTAVAIAGYALRDDGEQRQVGTFGAAWATDPETVLRRLYSVYGDSLQHDPKHNVA